MDKELPPHNLGIERAVLGKMLAEKLAAERGCALLVADDFYLLPHQLIFNAMSQLQESLGGADILLTTELLERQGLLEKCGGEAYFVQLVSEFPNGEHLELWITRLIALKRERDKWREEHGETRSAAQADDETT